MGADQHRPTLSEFFDQVWAPRARRRLALKTWERDEVVYRKHIQPNLGGREIATLDVEDLVEWQDALERAQVGAPTMIKAIGILSSIFGEAARRPRSTGVNGNLVSLLERPAAKRRRRPLVWGPVVVERARFQLLVNSRRAGRGKELMALRDALLVSLMEMTGCRPGEALALRWEDIGSRIAIVRRLSGKEIVDGTKTSVDRSVPLLPPLRSDLALLRRCSGDAEGDYVLSTPAGDHWVETDWRNYRSRHFRPALERVEAEWGSWREELEQPEDVRESVAGLTATRPYDLGRHTHSALMLASGMSLQRLARIQGHSIRVLDQTYSEQLVEFEDRGERIDPVLEIERARALVHAVNVSVMERHQPLVLGQLLRDARLRTGVSQSQLAVRTGIAPPALSRIENGHESPSFERFSACLVALGLEPTVELRELNVSEADPVHLAAEAQLTPAQRLESLFEWMRFGDRLARAQLRPLSDR